MTLSIIDIIQNSSIILKDGLSEYMCVLDSNNIENITEQWKYNRILNVDKVNEIKHVIKNKTILDSVLHFFYSNDGKNEKLICFDGNHRREALILLNKIDNINIKVCCYIYLNNNIINIDAEIINKFKIINQNTPIPDIYSDIIDNLNSTDLIKNKLTCKKNIIEETFNEYKIKYKKFYSISSKCRKPNFNDVLFKDLCNTFIFDDKKELDKYLLKLNNENSTKFNNKNDESLPKLSTTIINKCTLYKFYLFIY